MSSYNSEFSNSQPLRKRRKPSSQARKTEFVDLLQAPLPTKTKYPLTRDIDEMNGFSLPTNQTKYPITKNLFVEMKPTSQKTLQEGVA
mgnify:FL=1